MSTVAEPSLARRWRKSARRDADPARLTRGLAALACVGPVQVRPGLIEATVRASASANRTASHTASIGLDVLGPAFRARWLLARGRADSAGGRPFDGPVPDPMPAPGALVARCTCADVAPSGWCKHACALAEAVARALEGDGGPELLWRARGLVSDGPDAVVAGAHLSPQAVDHREAADAAAFWGEDADTVESQGPQAWIDMPAALARLGPLPTARGQTAAADPIVAHYRRVRDSVRPWFEGAEAAPKGNAGARQGTGTEADRPPRAALREETGR